MPSTLTDRHLPGWSVDHAAHSPAAIEQYPGVVFPRPFELGAGSKLFFVGHGTPKV
jgi:hypothetical protein